MQKREYHIRVGEKAQAIIQKHSQNRNSQNTFIEQAILEYENSCNLRSIIREELKNILEEQKKKQDSGNELGYEEIPLER